MSEREQDNKEDEREQDNKEDAAEGDQGQDQKPKQAEDTSSIFDTEQHSDAPGPFGTGDE